MIYDVTHKSVAAVGSDGDDADAWRARLGWAFGLIADDPAQRTAALAHLHTARRNTEEALDRFNELWSLTRPLGTDEQYREPAFKRAWEVYVDVRRHSLPEGVRDRPSRARIKECPGLPYALVFLEGEVRYPQEWTEHAKTWGTKEGLIRDVAVPDHDQAVRVKPPDLVESVVQRAYRCMDHEYVRVARAVDSEDLRRRLGMAAQSDNPWARLHAGYVLWLLDRPDVPNTRHVWRTWLAGASGTRPSPAGPRN
ncbi:hypothetical protein [Streptomyces canus]|uniref:hypothetical protein n=1 Tax=Streptomyces canus TaxID=58343 RepID=UPI003CE87A0D